MQRRQFLVTLTGTLTLPLWGCGSSSDTGASTAPVAPSPVAAGRTVTGLLAQVPPSSSPLVVVSAQQASAPVQGSSYTITLNSAAQTQLLFLADSQGTVLGLTPAVPDPLPFDATSAALAFLLMIPGFFTPDPTLARQRLDQVKTLQGFPDLVASAASIQNGTYQYPTSAVQVVLAQWAALQSFPQPVAGLYGFTATPAAGGGLQLYNGSWRAVQVVRQDLGVSQTRLDLSLSPSSPSLLAPGESLADPNGTLQSQYLFLGPGAPQASSLVTDLSLFVQCLGPVMEYVLGTAISLQQAEQVLSQRGLSSTAAYLQALTSQDTTALAASYDPVFVDNFEATLSSIAKLVTAGSYVAGLAFSIGAIFKFKQHKDNPTQVPIGTPIALVFIAAALLFLPGLLSFAPTGFQATGQQLTSPPANGSDPALTALLF